MLWFFAANKVVYKVATITKTSTVIAHLIIFTLPHEVGSIFAASAQQMSDTIYCYICYIFSQKFTLPTIHGKHFKTNVYNSKTSCNVTSEHSKE